jgi:hypothetical protein
MSVAALGAGARAEGGQPGLTQGDGRPSGGQRRLRVSRAEEAGERRELERERERRRARSERRIVAYRK